MRSALPHLTDERLTERICAGDESAFDALFRAYYGELVHFAASYLRAGDEPQEIVSEFFTWLWVHHATWEPRGAVRAYLFRAIRNRVLNQRRDTHRWDTRYDDVRREGFEYSRGAPSLAPDEALSEAEDREHTTAAIDRALAELPPRAREVASLRWRQGMSFEEIATVLESTPAAVQMQLSRALKVLRERIPHHLK